MKLIFKGIFACFLIMSCSSDDNNQDTSMNPDIVGDFSLVLNGNGFNEERFEFFRDTITGAGGNGLLFRADNDDVLGTIGDGIQVITDTPNEGSYTITLCPDNQTGALSITNTSVIDLNSERYFSRDGVFRITSYELDFDAQCEIWRGDFDINYTRNGNDGDLVNVTGTFNMPIYNCNLDD
jgi:hypothetical protein